MRTLNAITAALALATLAPPAFAHAMLERAQPAVGGRVTTSPSALRLEFSEGVEPSLSRVVLHNSAGASIELGALATAPGANRVLIAALRAPLGPGVYRVRWRAVSVDSHITEGEFAFTVRP